MACRGSMWRPKAPATKMLSRSLNFMLTWLMIVVRIEYMAALDRIRASRSIWLSNTGMPSTVSSAGATTNAGPSLSRIMRPPALAGLNFPLTSIILLKYRPATRSMMPEPQIPMGGLLSIVVYLIDPVSGSILTCSMAPLPARMPIRATPPSSAGPAAPAQAMNHSELPITTSAFVPTSMSMQIFSFWSRSHARMPEMRSPPK